MRAIAKAAETPLCAIRSGNRIHSLIRSTGNTSKRAKDAVPTSAAPPINKNEALVKSPRTPPRVCEKKRKKNKKKQRRHRIQGEREKKKKKRTIQNKQNRKKKMK